MTEELKDMRQYLGVKFVEATPMSLGDYNEHRGWKIPEDEDPELEGYIVRYPDGYISWCPKLQFEESNRRTDSLSFGHALEAAKRGKKIARAGWNGKGMWVSYSPGHPGLKAEDAWSTNVKKQAMQNKGMVNISPYLLMLTATGDIQCGWLASQNDMLADDWMIVE